MWRWLFLCTIFAAVVSTQFTCSAFTYQNDVWLRSYNNGVGLFDYRIGGGGDIAEMRDCQRNFAPLISPPYLPNVLTDRVIQLVWWDMGITHQVSKGDPRYNVNQAGIGNGVFSPTISVQLSNGGNCTVSVLSHPQDQWNTLLAPVIRGSYGMHTQYTATNVGWLVIRRTLLVSQAYLNGILVPLNNSYIEAWSPFRVPTFSGYALKMSSDGAPQWYYSTSNIPDYPAFPVQSTYGYGIVFTLGNPAGNSAVGMVFGTKQFVVCMDNTCAANGNGAKYVLNSMGFDVGICILPGMEPGPLQVGDIIDQHLILVPGTYLNSEFMTEVVKAVPTVVPPTLYRNSDSLMDADLKLIVQNLRSNTKPGERTDNLAPLVNQ